MKKESKNRFCFKKARWILAAAAALSLISGTVSAAETEMTKQSTESETQTSEAEPFQSSTELPVEEETEAPVETPIEVITEDFVAVPNENETEMKEPNGDENETFTEPVTEDSTQTPAEMTFDLATRVSLGVNQLKLKDGQQPFARSLFSEDEIRQGGHGNVLIYADLLDDLLKESRRTKTLRRRKKFPESGECYSGTVGRK